MSIFVSINKDNQHEEISVLNLDHVVRIRPVHGLGYKVELSNGSEINTSALYAPSQHGFCDDHKLMEITSNQDFFLAINQQTILPAEPNTKVHWVIFLEDKDNKDRGLCYNIHTVPVLGWAVTHGFNHRPYPISQRNYCYDTLAQERGLSAEDGGTPRWAVEYPNGTICDFDGTAWDSVTDWFNWLASCRSSGSQVTQYIDLFETNSKTAAADAEHIAGSKLNLWAKPKQKSQSTTAPVE